MNWHIDQRSLSMYVTDAAAMDDVLAASIEAHLMKCDQCRGRLATFANMSDLDDSWKEIADAIDRPRRGLSERALGWFLSDELARIVSATPALRIAWLTSMVVVVSAAVIASYVADANVPFLVLAPLVPLGGIAVSFGPAPDPAGEAALAAPLQDTALVLRRSIAVLVTSCTLLGVGTVVLPGLGWRAAGWLLPSIGLTFVALAASTWVSPFVATAASGGVWIALLQAAELLANADHSVVDSPLFGIAGQLSFIAFGSIGAITLALRHTRPAILEAR